MKWLEIKSEHKGNLRPSWRNLNDQMSYSHLSSCHSFLGNLSSSSLSSLHPHMQVRRHAWFHASAPPWMWAAVVTKFHWLPLMWHLAPVRDLSRFWSLTSQRVGPSDPSTPHRSKRKAYHWNGRLCSNSCGICTKMCGMNFSFSIVCS